MDDLGARLKHARETHGASLRDLATRTKISVAALEALERNDFSRLPGGIFGRAFVRAYAIEVGLDPDDVVAEFQTRLDELEREAAARGAARPEITADDREFLERQRRAIRILRVVVTIAAVGGVLLLAWRLRAFWHRGDAPPPAPAPAATAPVTPIAPPPADGPAVPAAGSVPPAPETRPPTGSPAATPPSTAPAPPASSGLVVDFEITEDCWVYAAADGTRVVSQLFRAGDTQRVNAEREILLDVGNAGAFKWTIGGRAAKPLGRAGVHQRARITPENVADFVQ